MNSVVVEPELTVPPGPSSTVVLNPDNSVVVIPPEGQSPIQDNAPADEEAVEEEQEEEEEDITPPPMSSKPIKSKPAPPQLIPDLPIVTEKALATFEVLRDCHYQYGTLGRSREALESMTCDCSWDGDPHPGDTDTCGSRSDCINRLTQVECIPDDCRCRGYCQNQRFQKKQYAAIEVVQTEKKGFGLRAAADIPKDGFIYEYVGDVVSQPSFAKRMRQYADEGIKHFYFMMLQKDEFIDATKRGGIGRFANHSCAPNCYVAKWTVGIHVRMGIFASRNVTKDEELTFNYNVDRYGHEAQPCYCGEPKCVGFIGGKTQTDIGAMDDLYLDALGISDEVDQMGLKGSKKKKGRKLDEDYIPILKPMVEKDIPKVIQAMRQVTSRKVLLKLLMRVKITQDQPALRQIMRLRGFSLMTNILRDHLRDFDIMIAAMECMMTWPLMHRNKVEDSKVEEPVKVLADCEHPPTKELAAKLLELWDTLETRAKIPKRLQGEGEVKVEEVSVIYAPVDTEHRTKRRRYEEASADDFKPVEKVDTPKSSKTEKKPIPTAPSTPVLTAKDQRAMVAATIAAANAAAAAQAAAKAEEAARLVEVERKRKERREKRSMTAEEKESNKEKRLQKLVGGVVVKCMSKYSKQLGKEQFKKHAKNLTQIIAEKEKKSSSYRDNKLESLSDEKVAKIKKFAKEYISKALRKMSSKSSSSSRHKPSNSPPPPDETSMAVDDGDETGEPGMSVEDIMDMAKSDDEYDDDDEEDTKIDADSSAGGDSLPTPAPPDTPMDIIPLTPKDVSMTASADPRIRKAEVQVAVVDDSMDMQ